MSKNINNTWNDHNVDYNADDDRMKDRTFDAGSTNKFPLKDECL